jgi:hypothetical protein
MLSLFALKFLSLGEAASAWLANETFLGIVIRVRMDYIERRL